MSVPAYVALEKEPDERSSSLRRQMNKETEGNGIHGKESMAGGRCYLEGRSGSQHQENVVSAWEEARNKVPMKIPQQIPFCSIQRFTYLKY